MTQVLVFQSFQHTSENRVADNRLTVEPEDGDSGEAFKFLDYGPKALIVGPEVALGEVAGQDHLRVSTKS